MAKNDVMKLDAQLGRLEGTVAKEFRQIGNRFDALDKRLDRLEVAFKSQDDTITAGFRDIAVRIDRLASRRSRRPKRS